MYKETEMDSSCTCTIIKSAYGTSMHTIGGGAYLVDIKPLSQVANYTCDLGEL